MFVLVHVVKLFVMKLNRHNILFAWRGPHTLTLKILVFFKSKVILNKNQLEEESL